MSSQCSTHHIEFIGSSLGFQPQKAIYLYNCTNQFPKFEWIISPVFSSTPRPWSLLLLKRDKTASRHRIDVIKGITNPEYIQKKASKRNMEGLVLQRWTWSVSEFFQSLNTFLWVLEVLNIHSEHPWCKLVKHICETPYHGLESVPFSKWYTSSSLGLMFFSSLHHSTDIGIEFKQHGCTQGNFT